MFLEKSAPFIVKYCPPRLPVEGEIEETEGKAVN
jgi:hypothetical protein